MKKFFTARSHSAAKHSGEVERISMDEVFVFVPRRSAEMVALDEALEELANPLSDRKKLLN